MQRHLEEDYLLKQEKMDKQLVEKERKMRADFRELEKGVDVDKNSFSVHLQQQFDQVFNSLQQIRIVLI